MINIMNAFILKLQGNYDWPILATFSFSWATVWCLNNEYGMPLPLFYWMWLNVTKCFLTGRRHFTVCVILWRVIWSTLDTHLRRPKAHIEFTLLSVRSWAHQHPIVLEQESILDGEIILAIERLWNTLKSKALVGLIPLSIYKHNKDTKSLHMRLFHSVYILICACL